MYTGYDVNLPDEEFRDSDPAEHGLGLRVPGARPAEANCRPYAYLPCPLGWGEGRKKAGPHGGFLGRRYDPFCTECTAYVDNPPDEIWKPQVVRGEPRLADTELLEGHHARSAARPPPAGRTVRRPVPRLRRRRDPGNFPSAAAAGLRHADVAHGARGVRPEPRRADRDPRPLRPHAVRLGDAAGPAAGRAGRAVRQRELGQFLQAVRGQQGGLGHARTQLPHAARDAAARTSTRPTRPSSKIWTSAACWTKRWS